MAGRGRLRLRAGLSRLPRWVTVLGIVLVLAVLTGIAALRSMGTTGLKVRLGLTRTVTVVLKIDGEPWYLLQPPPFCNGHGGPCDYPADTGTVTYTTLTGSTTYRYAGLPSTKKVRVPPGGIVTLNASSDADVVGCWIILNGKVLSQTRYTKDTEHTACRATIPSRAPACDAPASHPTSSPSPGTRRVTLRVGGLSSGDKLDYETPAETAGITCIPDPAFTKDLWVHSGAVVMIHAWSGRHDPLTCSIAVDGRLLLQRQADQWGRQGRRASCQARIPSGSPP